MGQLLVMWFLEGKKANSMRSPGGCVGWNKSRELWSPSLLMCRVVNSRSINKGCGKHTKYFWLMLSHLLIDGMFVSPPPTPNSPWNLIPKVLVFGRGPLGGDEVMRGVLTNMPSWKRPQRPPQPFHHGRTQQTDGHLWTRKGPHQTFYQGLDPGLSSLQICETVVYKQTT